MSPSFLYHQLKQDLVSSDPALGLLDEPDLDQLEEWAADGGCEATDGCWVEVDGTCPHGRQSWLLVLGLA